MIFSSLSDLSKLLCVGGNEFLHLLFLVLEAKLGSLVVGEVGPEHEEAAHLLLEGRHVLFQLGAGRLGGGERASGVENAASVGHFILIGVFGVVVKVD